MPLSALPNLLTGLRMLLALPISVALLQARYDLGLALFVLAAISDGLDGWIARRFGWTSQLGAMLDPAADKLLIVTSLALFAWLGVLETWVVVVVLARDLVIVGGALTYRLIVGPLSYGASLLGKLSTAAQLLLILVLVLARAPILAQLGAADVAQLLHAAESSLASIVALLALASGLHYVWTWTGRALAARAEHAG